MSIQSRLITPMVGLLALGAVAGCATTTATSTSAQATLPGKDACVLETNVRGWKVLDDQTLLTDAPTGGNRYLIKLSHPASGLASQEGLEFEDADDDGQLCAKGDSLRLGKPISQSVPIAAVRLITTEQAKTLMEPK